MRILGGGLIARSLGPYASEHHGVVAFASGVSDSSCNRESDFSRECRLLYRTLDEVRSRGERIIYFSGGGALYGRWNRPALESGPVEPQSPYGRHQLVCEAIVAAAGVRHLIVRLPNVVGTSASPKQLVPSLVAQVLVGRVHVQRRASRDLVDSRDMARIVSELVGRVADREVLNVATGVSVPALAIVSEICAILGAHPSLVVSDVGEPQQFDTSRLRQILGRDPFPDHSYYQEVLRSHVPQLAEELTHARV